MIKCTFVNRPALMLVVISFVEHIVMFRPSVPAIVLLKINKKKNQFNFFLTFIPITTKRWSLVK